MKIFFLFLSIVVVATLEVKAQSTTPRYGITANTDNTGRVLTYKYKAFTDAAGYDSINIAPNAWETDISLTVATDSLRIGNPTVTNAYFGDIVKFIITGTSGKIVSFPLYATKKWINAGKITLTTNGKCVIVFVFDGTKYVEQSRINL